MRILFLSRFPCRWRHSPLFEELTARGHQTLLHSPEELLFDFSLPTPLPPVRLNGEPLPPVDLLYPFWRRTDTYLHDILTTLEAAGVTMVNGPSTPSSDKREAAALLARHGIPMPLTFSVNGEAPLAEALARLKPPYVFKESIGSRGEKVFKISCPRQAETVGRVLIAEARDFIIQQFIDCGGQDVRALMIGGQVVAAMERTAEAGDFRANCARGASGRATVLTPGEEAQCLKVTTLFKAPVTGIDFIRTTNGPLMIEVNKNPGFSAIQKACDINAVSLMVNALEHAGATLKRA